MCSPNVIPGTGGRSQQGPAQSKLQEALGSSLGSLSPGVTWCNGLYGDLLSWPHSKLGAGEKPEYGCLEGKQPKGKASTLWKTVPQTSWDCVYSQKEK